MSFRAVVFDLDGTLIDSRGDIARSCNAMLLALGLPELPRALVSSFVGDGARLLVARALELPLEHERVTQGLELFLDHYETHPVVETTVLPGVDAACAALAGVPLGICTNKPRRTTDAVLRALGWTERFDAVVAGGDTRERKPHPEPLVLSAKELGVAAHELIMVGDGPQDIEAGRAVGAFTVGVRGGILAEERLLASRPDRLLNDLTDFPALARELGLI